MEDSDGQDTGKVKKACAPRTAFPTGSFWPGLMRESPEPITNAGAWRNTRIRKTAKRLANWIVQPDKASRVPKALRSSAAKGCADVHAAAQEALTGVRQKSSVPPPNEE